jgi:general stress protein 26
MNKPNKTVKDFLENNRVSVLGILQEKNSIHSASLHFAHSINPLVFYFLTNNDTLKSASLIDGSEQNASLVIGFDEGEFTTFQSRGKAKIVKGRDEDKAWRIYSGKFKGKEKSRSKEKVILIEFRPNWWRYTDLKTSPWTKFHSE